MENLNTYIKEALVNHKVKLKYSYHPKTKDELIEAIKTELKEGNTNLNCIDTSEITDMEYLFASGYFIKLTNEQQENLDISNWNVSKVTTMCRMFFDCENFNSDLSKWDVSNVTNMLNMFYNCKQFNSDLSNWDVSNVIDMYYMFEGCEQFNSDLSKWNVSNVTNMHCMFKYSGLEGKEPSWYKNK